MASEPFTLLESILLRYQEMEAEGIAVEERFPLLKSYVNDLVDVVKDYQLMALDQLINAAFIAANNVQDVRLYSLEARLNKLENESITIGEMIVEIFVILALEVGLVALAGEAIPAALAAGAGLVIYSLNRRSLVRAARRKVKIEIKGIEKSIAQQRLKKPEGSLEAVTYRTGSGVVNGFRWVENRDKEKIESVIKELGEELQQALSRRDTNIRRAERASERLATARRDVFNEKFQGIYDRFKDLRGSDSLSATLQKASGLFAAQPPEMAESERNALTPTAFVAEVIALFQEMKIEVVNGAAYDKEVVRRYADEATFFDDLDVADVLIGLEDLYPRIIYSFDALLNNTVPVADRIEAGIWYAYMKANGLLEISMVNALGFAKTEFDGIFYSGATLATQVLDPGTPTITRHTVVPIIINGHYYKGMRRLSEQQAKYLFDKFAVHELEKIKQILDPYETEADIEQLLVPDLSDSVDDPEKSFLGFKNEERDLKVRLTKVCVLTFFQIIDDRLYAQSIKSKQFGEEKEDQPLKDVLDLLVPPQSDEAPPESPQEGESDEDILREALEDFGLPQESDLRPDVLMLEIKTLLLELKEIEQGEWQISKVAACDKIADLLGEVRAQALDDQQREKLADLEALYAKSSCNILS